MPERTYTIVNREGLHARPAAKFVKLTSGFESEIWVKKDDDEVNGKSIMGLMMLAAEQGSSIAVIAEGSDAEEALDRIGALIENGFADVS
ncbi:MAG: HPr family phosphocarrier protein [Verrucomicrobiae bacterium]|nr:HPr family phosphocarrier protein [Verrucomicrobiae bacterium]MCP5540724.1 HPr family phosphocarrier protein [Akkermansiaceae bacterium]